MIEEKEKLEYIEEIPDEIMSIINTAEGTIYEDYLKNKELFNTLKNKQLMKQLKTDVENGKNYSVKDINYEILYQLSIIENISDGEIGKIFGLNKGKINYQRKKYGLQNVFTKRYIDFMEYYCVNRGNISAKTLKRDFLLEVYLDILIHCKIKKYDINVLNKYFIEKLTKEEKSPLNDTVYLDDLELEYDVVISKRTHKGHKKRNKSVSKGRKTNQEQSNINKIKAGKQGEQIVYKYEKSRLKNLGLLELSEQVNWITKTEDKAITLDGLGYDIISFNERGEKIYIEVKTSTTNNSDNIDFNISDKEVKLMNGELKGIDKNHCFIYYVSKINKNLQIAEIHVIDHNEFKQYNLIPTQYKVSEIYE